MITAQFPGPCAAGCAGVKVGDTITSTPDGWTHSPECPDREPLVGKPCPRCFVTMPLTGRCDDCD